MIDLPSWLWIVPVLAFLVFVHELGHFVTAKAFGVMVTEFAFGLPIPPRLIGFTYRGTTYSVYWLPLGGFVRMVGEDDPTHPQSLARLSVAKRAAILMAGSVVNLIVPVVIFTILFLLPHQTLVGGEVMVTAVVPGSPAHQAGLRPGDTILQIDGHRIMSPSELIDRVEDKLGQPVEFGLRRTSPLGLIVSQSPEYAVFETVHVVPDLDPPSLVVVENVDDPATQVSLRDARRYDPSLEVGGVLRQRPLGVRIALVNPKVGSATEPIWSAVPMSVETIWSFLELQWNGIAEGLATRTNPGFAGPIGIAQATGEVVDEMGFAFVFQLTALLSVILGIVNILPIPALDGGRLLFVIIEWVRRGKRISPEREGLVHLVGFAVVIMLIFVLSYGDVTRILRGDSILP